MILLHRIRGEPFHLNADLIETIEPRGDTVLTLEDGRRLVVTETLQEVVDAIRGPQNVDHRHRGAARAERQAGSRGAPGR